MAQVTGLQARVASRRPWWPVAVLAGLAIALSLVLLDRGITDTPNDKDAAQNMVAAYNLAFHGVFSEDIPADPAATPVPGPTREPLPIVALAAHMALHPGLDGTMGFEATNSGAAVVAVKRHNLIWAAAVLAGAFVLVQVAVRPAWVAMPAGFLAMAMTHAFFLGIWRVLDTTYTEVQAAALTLWGSVALVRALQGGGRGWFFAAGLLVGALALTKAISLYVGGGLIVCLFAVLVVAGKAGTRRAGLAQVGLVALGLALVTGPWIVRNAVLYDNPQITGRSGEVMIIRAVKNGMTEEEARGAFTAWGPGRYLVPLLGRDWAFGPEELEEGGRLQRFNRGSSSSFAERDLAAEEAGRPEDAISFYRQARAERMRLRLAFEAAGHPDPVLAADETMRAEAVAAIRADLPGHLAMTPAYLWRSVWMFNIGIVPGPVRIVLNATAFGLLWVFAILGLFTRSPAMLGIGLVPVGTIALYALASHAIPRYSEPAVPNMIVALVVTLAWAVAALATRIRARRTRPAP